MIGRWLAGLVDCAINRIAPVDTYARSYLTMNGPDRGADQLADLESRIDSWDPALFNDVLTLPADQTADEFVANNRDLFTPNQPAGAVASPPTASGAGGSTTTSIATVIAVVLRGQGINSAPIYADLIARELTHHFDIKPK